MEDLFAALDEDWLRWFASPAAPAAFARWAAVEPDVASTAGMSELVQLFDRPGGGTHQARDAVLLGLLRLARHDGDAHRTVLRILRAGLVNHATRARPWWGWDEAASAAVAAAVEQVRHYPMRRTGRVAANLLGDVWHAMWLVRQAERRHEALGAGTTVDELGDVADRSEPPAAQQVLALVGEALDRGRISRRDARLVTLHRVFGYTNPEVATMEGCRPCTVRKRRAAAEAAILDLAVA
ncbi:MAG: hypothetical protein M3Q48_15095 [Actinomycetota bacterium]|nr:hypothetical protein [Actinomycetota bacterium]